MLTSQTQLMPSPATTQLSPRQKWFAAILAPVLVAPFWLSLGIQNAFGTLSGLLLALLLVASTITDVSSRKIYNWATYTAFAYAIAVNMVFSPNVAWAGSIGLSQCLGGAAVCFALMLMAYTLARGGAGDVKLATAIGAICGVGDGMLIIAFTYIIAAVSILGWTIWRQGPITLLSAFVRRVGAALLPERISMPTEQQVLLLEKPIPLAGFFALGSLCVVLDVPQLLRSL